MILSTIAPPRRESDRFGDDLHVNRNGEAEQKEHLGIPTLGCVFASIAHLRCFLQPGTKHQALYDHFLHESIGLILGGG